MSRLLRKMIKIEKRKRYFLKNIKTNEFSKRQDDLKSRHQKWLRTHKNSKGEEPKEEDPLRKLQTKTNQ